MKYLLLALLGIIGLSNLAVFFLMPLKTMYQDFWENQSWVGRITTNLFYAPVWLLKGLIYGLILGIYWVLFSIRYFITILYRIFKVLYGRVLGYMI